MFLLQQPKFIVCENVNCLAIEDYDIQSGDRRAASEVSKKLYSKT